MQVPHQHLRINLADLKAQIVKRLGPERSKQYFYYLNGLLSSKLSKVEFNKLCYRVIGRENVPLHNQFICSILKNACHAKAPPTRTHDKEVAKSTGDGYKQTALSNGYLRVGDHPSPLGPNGNVDFASQRLKVTGDGGSNVVLDNGKLTPNEIRKPVQHHQVLNVHAENEGEVLPHHPAKLPSIKGSENGPIPVHSKGQVDVLAVDGRNYASTRSLVSAPLGIPFFSDRVSGAHRALPLASSSGYASSFDSGGLLDTETMRERMKQIAATRGLEGVSMDCANLLNNGLDIYLKGLIRSCIELVGARSGHEPVKNSAQKCHHHGKLVNGLRLAHHYQMQSGSRPVEGMREQRPHCAISLLDFKVAMELNPHQLGEDWPLLLEKICTQAFEE